MRTVRPIRRFQILSAFSLLLSLIALVLLITGGQQLSRDVQALTPAMPTTQPPTVSVPLRPMTTAQVAALATQPNPTGTPAAMAAQFAYALQLGDAATAASQLEPAQRRALAGATPQVVNVFLSVASVQLRVDRATGPCQVPALPAFPPAGGWQPELVTVPVLCPGSDVQVMVRLSGHGPVGVHVDRVTVGPADTSAPGAEVAA